MCPCTYLLTYTVGSVRIKPAISPVTINSLYKIVQGLLIAEEYMTLNNL